MTDARDGGGGWVDKAVELLAAESGESMFRVRGSDNSMRPTLEPGARVLVRFAPERLCRGDLLLFRQADYYVVHRLLGRARFPDGRRCLRTRGDRTTRLDPPLDPGDVVGRAEIVESRHGWRSLRGLRPRIYAGGAALHDLCWAGIGVLVERAGGVLRPVRPLVASLDRGLLYVAHLVAFRLLHPRVEEPRVLAASRGKPDAEPDRRRAGRPS
jgi:hypothetical protein